jgi:hypothetical protein
VCVCVCVRRINMDQARRIHFDYSKSWHLCVCLSVCVRVCVSVCVCACVCARTLCVCVG